MKPLAKLLLTTSMGILMVLGVLVAMRVQVAAAATAPNQTQVINSGLAYIKSQQEVNGGIKGFSGVADPDTTARSVLAFVAAGTTLKEAVSAEGNSMVDYLSTQAITFTHDTTGSLFPGRAGELLAAVSLAGQDPTKFGGMDLTRELEAAYHADLGTYSTGAKLEFASGEASDLNQAWAILGLSLAGAAVPDTATQYLVQAQAADGSWGAGDPDTTALAVTALLASHNVDAKSAAIQNAIAYFHTSQADSGGWKPSWDKDPLNADSTGWIIQALVSAGEDLRGQNWLKNSVNPVDALLGLQKPDGSIGGTYANTYSTAEAIIGLSGIPLSTYAQIPVPHRAGLAVFSSPTSLVTDCISFTGSAVTGLEMLQRSGLAIETATNPNQGTAVCKIGDVGDGSSNCFGSMPNYWSYWQLGSQGWEYSAQGADQSQVKDGGVYAWIWGTGNAPPVITFQNICEGLAYTMPASTVTSATATTTSTSNPIATLAITQASAQPTPAAVSAGTNTVTYVIYAAVLLVLAVVIIVLIRSRGRGV